MLVSLRSTSVRLPVVGRAPISVREAIDLLLATGDAAAIDDAIVEGSTRATRRRIGTSRAFEGALAAIKAEPW